MRAKKQRKQEALNILVHSCSVCPFASAPGRAMRCHHPGAEGTVLEIMVLSKPHEQRDPDCPFDRDDR